MPPSRSSDFCSSTMHAFRLYRHKTSCLGGSQWKESWLLLQKDGTIVWSNDKQFSTMKGKVHIHDCDMAFGLAAFQTPNCVAPSTAPFQPDDRFCYFVIFTKPTLSRGRFRQWFYAKDRFDVVSWLSALSAWQCVAAEFKEVVDCALCTPSTVSQLLCPTNPEGRQHLRRWLLGISMSGDVLLPYQLDSAVIYEKLQQLVKEKKGKEETIAHVESLFSAENLTDKVNPTLVVEKEAALPSIPTSLEDDIIDVQL
uniref:PH domain-containing protein n=1 Tax=Trichuris muris TaxID=70415 RepID=A0A5S6Q8T8_TRIMR